MMKSLALVSFAAASLHPQTMPPDPKYRFEVASIRPSNAPTTTNRLGPTPQGGLRGENVTATQLIALAFGVRPFLIVDVPAWASTQRYDILATPDMPEELPPGASPAQRDEFRARLRQRIHALLRDRFTLVVRTEDRAMPVYRLVAARGGHKLTPAAPGETRRMESNSTMLRGASVDMKTLADALTGILGRPVVDATDLSGEFTFSLKFADVRPQAAPEADPAPTIFTAISGQLGLRLESARAPTPVIVVEKLEKPTAN